MPFEETSDTKIKERRKHQFFPRYLSCLEKWSITMTSVNNGIYLRSFVSFFCVFEINYKKKKKNIVQFKSVLSVNNFLSVLFPFTCIQNLKRSKN